MKKEKHWKTEGIYQKNNEINVQKLKNIKKFRDHKKINDLSK